MSHCWCIAAGLGLSETNAISRPSRDGICFFGSSLPRMSVGYPSGQRGQTVNLEAQKVRIGRSGTDKDLRAETPTHERPNRPRLAPFSRTRDTNRDTMLRQQTFALSALVENALATRHVQLNTRVAMKRSYRHCPSCRKRAKKFSEDSRSGWAYYLCHHCGNRFCFNAERNFHCDDWPSTIFDEAVENGLVSKSGKVLD